MNMEKYAYITIITNKKYLQGSYVLHQSLQNVSSAYPFYVLIPSDIDSNIIHQLNSHHINIIYSDNHYQDIFDAHNMREYWKETIFKLEVFNLIQFDKIIFLDADMIVLKNIDSLFLKPHMSAVIAGKVLHNNWINLNSGLMVIEPNSKDYKGMLDIVNIVYQARTNHGLGFGDQDVIKAYYKNWCMMQSLHLKEIYNTMLGYAGCLRKAHLIESIDDIYVYHFTGKQKPWSRSVIDLIIIIIKIFKRSGFSSMDYKILLKYMKVLSSNEK